MFVHPDFEGLMIIGAGKDGGRESFSSLKSWRQTYWRINSGIPQTVEFASWN